MGKKAKGDVGKNNLDVPIWEAQKDGHGKFKPPVV